MQLSCVVVVAILVLSACIDSTGAAVEVISDDRNAKRPVQLTADSFDAEITAVPSSYNLLVEFYAHWHARTALTTSVTCGHLRGTAANRCPSCQKFQPAYEAVAAFFHSEPHPKPQVWVARVDCAEEVKLCNRFGIKRYPTMKFGNASDFTEVNLGGLQEISGGQTDEELVKWLAKTLKQEYNYGVKKIKPSHVTNSSDASSAKRNEAVNKASAIDIESATKLAWRYMLDSGDLLKEEDARQAFVNFLELLTASHPLSSCQRGSAYVVDHAAELWPAVASSGPLPAMKDVQICGTPDADEEWTQCQGSKPGRRGYTCGLWMLLHSLAAETQPEDTGGAFWMAAVKGFVQHFFQCSLCADHYIEMTDQPDAEAVKSKRDAVLWMWKAHNQVNSRLQDQEKDGKDGDPAFSKHQWPSSELCPLCHLPSSKADKPKWNEEETYRFLLKYYGKAAVTSTESLSAQEAIQQLYQMSRKSAVGTSRRWWLLVLIPVAVVSLVLWQRQRSSSRKRSNWL